MTSINELLQAIRGVDTKEEGTNGEVKYTFEGLSYQLTTQNKVGVPVNDKDFLVLAPWNQWSKREIKPGSSPLEEAFKAVLRKGAEAAVASGQEKVYIDITSLEGGLGEFFQDGSPDNSVAKAIAEIVDGPLKDVTPVIRILVGCFHKHDIQEELKTFQRIFWNGNAEPLIKNKKASLHVGFYGPNFKMPEDIRNILKLGIAAITAVSSIYALFAGEKDTVVDQASLVAMVSEALSGSKSWNHGKIVAVGGKTMMTGGMNPWEQYTSAKQQIIDLAIKITGDATISAHTYADYFWKYLEKPHSYDEVSFRRYINLSSAQDLSTQWKGGEESGKVTTTPAMKLPQTTTKSSEGISVLTVSRVGDWHGPGMTLEYPVMVQDAVRDLMLNIQPLGDDLLPQKKCEEIVKAIRDVADDAEGEIYASLFRKGLNCSPAAWASRFAIQHAISKATRTVYLSNQMVALKGLQEGASFEQLKSMVNGYIKEGEPKWDDLLLAIAQVLNKLKDSKDDDEGVFIVLTPNNAPDGADGWQDKTNAVKIGTRIKNLLRGLNPELGEEGVRKVVKSKFHLKRVNEEQGIGGLKLMHSKAYCVDSKLLYIGSDNLYPSYNEEHGVWIEDPVALSSWKANYWDGLWEKA